MGRGFEEEPVPVRGVRTGRAGTGGEALAVAQVQAGGEGTRPALPQLLGPWEADGHPHPGSPGAHRCWKPSAGEER